MLARVPRPRTRAASIAVVLTGLIVNLFISPPEVQVVAAAAVAAEPVWEQAPEPVWAPVQELVWVRAREPVWVLAREPVWVPVREPVWALVREPVWALVLEPEPGPVLERAPEREPEVGLPPAAGRRR